MKKLNEILVTGDYVIDHHLLKGNKSEAFTKDGIGTAIVMSYGGAKLTHDLIEKFINKINEELKQEKDKNKVKPHGKCSWAFVNMPELGTTQGSSRDSYLRWVITEKTEKNIKKTYCKLDEKLGFGSKLKESDEKWLKVEKDHNNKQYNTIIIDEAAVGFRNKKEAWPDFTKADKIILKTTHPLCEGKLWDKLLENKEKLITIVNLNQIKQKDIKVSNDISWEQTAMDIVYGLHHEKTLKNLLKCSEVIVTIGTAGALYLKNYEDLTKNEYILVYDPENMENEWEEKYSKKIQNRIGIGSSFIAGFTSSLIVKNVDIVKSIKVGLNAMNAALIRGVFELNDQCKFEILDISEAIDNHYEDRYYSSTFVPSPAWESSIKYLHNQDWSILENNYDNLKPGYKQKNNLFSLAFSLAENGKESLHYAPRLTLGDVTVFDRNEIENIRNIKKQVDFYDQFDNGKKPLNIAVFGPPGAGKSFIVKALANSMFEGKKTKPSFLTFNLSQFKDESELSGAYHAIRDEVLRGKLPIVFWDEFDSNNYYWLKSMIGPMQDGEFQEGKEVHPIGKAIFVFAGGMTYTLSQFAEKMDLEDYIVKKGPDFQSRINCYLNVFGPNMKPYRNSQTSRWEKDGDTKDICFSIRRALFIRNILGSDDRPLNIDKHLLRLLIEVSYYKNGSRGLERLLKNLAVHKDRMIEISDLPSKEIINMNVNYESFIDNLTNDKITDTIAYEKIAESIHNAWLEKGEKNSVYYEKYEDLSYDERIDNIKAADRIRLVIEKTKKFKLISEAELKSKMLPDAKKEFSEYIKNNTNLDKLAEQEHDGWKKEREAANWHPGSKSYYHKLHDCLVSFKELDKGKNDRAEQKEKNKDRNSINKYVSMLEGSGFTITFKE